MSLLELPLITVSGSTEAMGRAYGAAVAGMAREFVAQRQRAAKAYLRERGIRDAAAISDLGRRCLEQLKQWDHEGWLEHRGVAEGAGIPVDELYTAANYTDLRDVVTFPLDREAVIGHGHKPHAPHAGGHASGHHAPKVDGEGCTALLLPGRATAGGEVIAAQTWDLNPTDLDFVVAVHRRPTGAPETWSITCAGCPSLIGMNEHGVAVGTTNIKTRGARVGVPYLSILHRALGSHTRAEAAAVIGDAPRAAAHTYWIADAAGAEDFECSVERCVHRVAEAPLARTNHCLDDAHRRIEGEPPTSSSLARLARTGASITTGKQSVESLKRVFADRSDGVDSVNRFAEDNQGTSTNACVVAVPARRELHACRGSADRGAWVVLRFGDRSAG